MVATGVGVWHYCRQGIHPLTQRETFRDNSEIDDSEHSSVRFLKINRKVTALAAGKFETADQGDTLVDVPDGVSAMLFAPAPRAASSVNSPSQMVVVGQLLAARLRSGRRNRHGLEQRQVRVAKANNGEAVHKEVLKSPVAALVTADYRMDGKEEIICCSADGEIRGYFTATGDFPAPGASSTGTNDKASQEEKEVAKLSKHRAALQLEMKALEANQAGGTATAGKGLRIRADTNIKVRSLASKTATNFELEVSTENDAVIKMVVMFESEAGIFEGESLVVRPATMSPTVRIPLNLNKHAAARLDFKVLVAHVRISRMARPRVSGRIPQQMEEFRNLLVRVDESNAIRLKLTGEMADDSNQVKNLIIRVEDSRILNDMPRMRRFYSELFSLNNQLLASTQSEVQTTRHFLML
ncbi:Ciliary BBSome complex subunit 2, C-terminal domain [Phytophthora cactorum]|nr:Ciliary BBSome complex subunit 2, C-terminal domain [Phytophthora cactorum]